MHYIRFLKPPRPSAPSAGCISLRAKIAITTDLGESFLTSDIAVLVGIEDEDEPLAPRSHGTREYLWKGQNGMRSLEVEVKIPLPGPNGSRRQAQTRRVRMVIRPTEPSYMLTSHRTISQIEAEDPGSVLQVRSIFIDVARGSEQKIGPGMALRLVPFRDEYPVHIWEETGESIARHIWDAGLELSSYLVDLLIPVSPRPASSPPVLSRLEQVLKEIPELRILELGAGCGIVGITLAMHMRVSKPAQVLLTDLPEASEILTHNISECTTRTPELKSLLSNEDLDWSTSQNSPILAQKWHLVVIADCTYNPDVVPDLVQTLKHIADASPKVLILLAMKIRHQSEMVFFKLMINAGFLIVERCVMPLPVLGGEDEEIEIFVFGTKAIL